MIFTTLGRYFFKRYAVTTFWFLAGIFALGQRPTGTKAITLQPSAVSGSITVTASADFFVAGHVGLTFAINGGIVEIDSVTDSTHADETEVSL